MLLFNSILVIKPSIRHTTTLNQLEGDTSKKIRKESMFVGQLCLHYMLYHYNKDTLLHGYEIRGNSYIKRC